MRELEQEFYSRDVTNTIHYIDIEGAKTEKQDKENSVLILKFFVGQ